MKKYLLVMLFATCQQTVMANVLDTQQCTDAVCDGVVMMKTGVSNNTALSNSWRPIIRRPHTTPPAPPPAQPLPSPRPSTSGSTSGGRPYPSYLPGSDYARRS